MSDSSDDRPSDVQSSKQAARVNGKSWSNKKKQQRLTQTITLHTWRAAVAAVLQRLSLLKQGEREEQEERKKANVPAIDGFSGLFLCVCLCLKYTVTDTESHFPSLFSLSAAFTLVS